MGKSVDDTSVLTGSVDNRSVLLRSDDGISLLTGSGFTEMYSISLYRLPFDIKL